MRGLASPPALQPRPSQTVPQWAVWASALPPVLLVGSCLVADSLQPPSYSPVRQTMSVLAGQNGTYPWIMTEALFVIGACYLMTAIGLVALRPPARVLLAIGGMSTVGIALSPEPSTGPTPAHLAWTGIGAAAMAIWPVLAGRRLPRRPLVLTTGYAAAATAVLAALLVWVLVETQGGGALGLAERLCSCAEATWPFVVALALRRSPVPAPGEDLRVAEVPSRR